MSQNIFKTKKSAEERALKAQAKLEETENAIRKGIVTALKTRADAIADLHVLLQLQQDVLLVLKKYVNGTTTNS